MHRQPDSFLLENLKGGNQKAFDMLFVKYYKLLVANAFFIIRDEQEAKDIVQDFLFEFWHKKTYLKLEGDIKGYLYRSVQNKCINFHRNQTLEHHKYALLAQEIPSFEGHEEEREIVYVRLEDAINDLPPQRKEVLHRIYFEKKRYREAADDMGISMNTLKTHLRIGLNDLREKLNKD